MRRWFLVVVVGACASVLSACSNSVDLGSTNTDASTIDDMNVVDDADTDMEGESDMGVPPDMDDLPDMSVVPDMPDAFTPPVGTWTDRMLLDAPSALEFDVAIDSTGTMHFVAPDAESVVHFEPNPDLSVTRTTISESLVQEQLAIAVDEDNNLHVAFLDDDSSTVIYAKRVGSTWTTEALTATVNSEEAVAIAASTTFGVAISYLPSSTSRANVLWKQAGGWLNSTLSQSLYTVRPNPVAFDSVGNLHLCANDGDAIRHGVVSTPGGVFTQQSATSISSYQAYEMLIDASDDSVHILVADRASGMDRVVYANNRSGSFSARTIVGPTEDGVALDLGFAISPLGAIGIVYANYSTRDVYYGEVPATGPVEFEEIRSSPNPSYGHGLVYDSVGRPNVAYSDIGEMYIIGWHE